MKDMVDEERIKKDMLELIDTFINRSINTSGLLDSPRWVEKKGRLGNLSFVITRSKSSSWAEDLADFRSVEEINRAFN